MEIEDYLPKRLQRYFSFTVMEYIHFVNRFKESFYEQNQANISVKFNEKLKTYCKQLIKQKFTEKLLRLIPELQ